METSFKILREKVKDKRWIGRSILLLTVIVFIVYIMVSNSTPTTDLLTVLRSKNPITKVELKIGSDSPVTYVVLTDPAQLDSINYAFQIAAEKSIPRGGAFATWAEVNVYKRNQKVDLFIQHSVYNGWMIHVGDATLTSKYLFALVRRYAQSEEGRNSRWHENFFDSNEQ